MSHPPPPPPPPPIPSGLAISLSVAKIRANRVDGVYLNADKELENYIQDEKKRRKMNVEPTILKIFHSVTPIIQDGPTCGMVALSMGLSLAEVSPQHLLELAIHFGWSRSGEMFSCVWMRDLARAAGATNSVYIEGGLNSHFACIVDCLSRGGFLLVPYDKSKNFTPGLLGGKSAHWALVTGIVIIRTSDCCSDVELSLKPCCCARKPAALKGNVRSLRTSVSSEYGVVSIDNETFLIDNVTEDAEAVSLYVCAYQGLSNHVNLWAFSELCASNKNLFEVNPDIKESLVLPEGGIVAGLCGRAVLVLPPF